MVCAFVSGAFTRIMSSRLILHWKKTSSDVNWVHFVSCNSAFDISYHFVNLCRETVSPYTGSLFCSVDHSGAYTVWKWGFSFPWGWAPSKPQGPSCTSTSSYSLHWPCICWLFCFPSSVFNSSESCSAMKDVAWFSMSSVKVPKGKSKHLYLE